MTTPDLLDISRYQATIDWTQVPDVPIVHKVNEGKAIDRRWAERAPIISNRHLMFGGYTVLIVSASTIRQQIETYAEAVDPCWRDGACTQLDIEPWAGRYPRPVNVDEILEAAAVHDELLGADRVSVYINPNEMPGTFQQWYTANKGERPLWLPDYSPGGATQAHRWNAAIHQYSSTYRCPGFTQLVDANAVLSWAELERICNLNHPAPPIVEDDDMAKILINDTVLEAVFTVDGDPVSGESLTKLLADGYTIVDQDHEQWRKSMLTHVGGPAAYDYGWRAAQRSTTVR